MPDLILDHLAHLVSFDTANPPRRITTRSGIVPYARDVLTDAGFDVRVDDLGDGQVVLLAIRGAPDLLFNVHLDTVPAGRGWSGDPRTLRVDGEKAFGLGACDVKGAAACLLAAAQRSAGPAALLLTTDEEAGTSRCVREAITRLPLVFSGVVVAEPTELAAVTTHRGIASYELSFRGRAAHTSSVDAADGSALHHAVRWAYCTLARVPSLADLRLNLGVLEGGTKANVAAASARVELGMRPWTIAARTQAVETLEATAGPSATLSIRFEAPPLTPSPASLALVEQLELTVGRPVDFWTEAALFADAGLPSIVYGPGSITQAHAADEWVDIGQLRAAVRTYERLFCGVPAGTA